MMIELEMAKIQEIRRRSHQVEMILMELTSLWMVINRFIPNDCWHLAQLWSIFVSCTVFRCLNSPAVVLYPLSQCSHVIRCWSVHKCRPISLKPRYLRQTTHFWIDSMTWRLRLVCSMWMCRSSSVGFSKHSLQVAHWNAAINSKGDRLRIFKMAKSLNWQMDDNYVWTLQLRRVAADHQALPAALLLLFQCGWMTTLDPHGLAHISMQLISSIQSNEFGALVFGTIPEHQRSHQSNPSNHFHLNAVQSCLHRKGFCHYVEWVHCRWWAQLWLCGYGKGEIRVNRFPIRKCKSK